MTETCVYDPCSPEIAGLVAFFLPVLLLFLCRCHRKTPPRVATRHKAVDAAVLGAEKRMVRAIILFTNTSRCTKNNRYIN